MAERDFSPYEDFQLTMTDERRRHQIENPQPEIRNGKAEQCHEHRPADNSGSALLFSIYLGGSGSDRGRGIVLGPMGDLYIAGFTSSTDFPTVNPFQGSYGGGDWDAFVAIIM
jgi:hypothetical protein